MNMIARVYVERELKKLDRLYSQASSGPDPYLPKLYSKLAVLELCGWTEEYMDNLIARHTKRKRLKEAHNIDFVEKEIIKKNWGFSYDYHFRRMLIQTISIIELERLEKKLNQTLKASLEAALTKLHPERDTHAHVTVRTAKTFTAPSVCIALFKDIQNGLFEYEKRLKKL